MSATIQEIVKEALTVIGEVSGSGVNQYSEDRMKADAIRSFNLLFKKYHWDQFNQWIRFQLDGVTGKAVGTPFDFVRDFEDILKVTKDTHDYPLPLLRKGQNPYAITGTSLQCYAALPTTDSDLIAKRLQFYSVKSTDFVNVQCRVYPIVNGGSWDWTDVMDLDKDMLVCGTAYMTLSSDDLNPEAAEAQKNMMEIRYKDIIAAFADKPVRVSHTGQHIPMDWRVLP